MEILRDVLVLRDGTPTNKKKTPTNKKNTFRARETPFNKQEKYLSGKGYLPIKCKSLQVVGVSGQGKAVVSDGG